ncbi:hypothetical protein [Fructobacillus evanidus]|uniref:Uncharacterized protein n=1 Tax=Fructobacillus evanidus TaxID=3064281 RepID=A0ABN9YHP8_9LACO|nr:unnamed protein product [Fructobacillus sp. LMG 32999]CAK1222731.1 unnamed protein product [Fructobacillus sp. LMG 32999]CAK1223580.1 unnamed protein product [Fructobacillus sp. LMG 32999]CAK1223638.1 unnamed protein product [Fructobacillus sp. LMG 32999]CAK1223787.1 unnamed protein product [Fructobacillus sp. LMG 32999]
MSKYFNYLEIQEGKINQSLSNLNLQDDKYFDPDSYSLELYADMKTVF